MQRPPIVRETANSVGATGIFTAEQYQWKMEYKLIRPALNRSNVKEYLAVMSQMVDRLVKKWKEPCDETTKSPATASK
jgi:cytochrome P450